ncbi:MAG TPA: DUF2304 domain-containing protein [Ramlibacter sp.]|nr:DUF2304 domain-containing protein [Ramlibacter sp.]
MWIKLLLLAAVLLTLVWFVRSEHTLRLRASKKLAFFAFVLLFIYAVLRPDDLSKVANWVGVGRGADLLLYLLAVGVVFIALNFYLKVRQLERAMTDLAREVAVREGEALNRRRGLLTE